MSAGNTQKGMRVRAPFSVYTDAKGTLVEVVDVDGNVTGGIMPGTITADMLIGTTNKLEFYSSANYINAPSDGKIKILATAGGADDIELSGGITLTGTVAISGAAALASTLAVTGAVTLSSTLAVTGAATLSSTLAVTGAVTLSSTLASGAVTITGALSVSTTSLLSGLVTMSAGAAVTGKVTATVGLQARATAVTATVDGLTTGIIPDDTGVVTVTSSVNTKLVTLPTPTPGVILQINAEATGYNLRSSTPASVAINGGTGAAAKSAVSAKTLVCRCVSATAWIVTAYGADGTESAQAAAS